jgi:parallel beta-helix repeat protein
MLRRPPNGDPYLTELVATLNAELARKEPTIVGTVYDGSNLGVRFRSPLDAPWVQVHVQSTAAGKGGVAAYDPANYVSTTLVDCRADRLQDRTIALTPGLGYAVFLAPVQYDGAGTKVLYDGVGGRPDAMAKLATGGPGGMPWGFPLGVTVNDALQWTGVAWVAQKLPEYNVRTMFGAAVDGATDDTAKVQAAIAAAVAAGGGRVLVPATGHACMVSSNYAIVLGSNVELVGEPGAELKAISNSLTDYAIVYATCVSNVAVRNLKITGDRGTHGGGGEWGMGVHFEGVLNGAITDCYIKDCWGDGIYIGSAAGETVPCQDIRITSCTSDNNRRQGLSVVGCLRGQIIGNTFKNTNGTAPQAGIDVEPNAVSQVSDIAILGNICINNTGAGILFGSWAPVLTPGCSVEGNTVLTSGGAGISVSDAAAGCLVRGNTVRSCTTTGISTWSDDSEVSGNTISACATGIIAEANRVSVLDNTIRSVTGIGINAVGGYSYARIAHNLIDGAVGNGIYSGQASTTCSFNQVKDVTTVVDGMVKFGAVDGARLIGNVCLLTTPDGSVVPFYFLAAHQPAVFLANLTTGTAAIAGRLLADDGLMGINGTDYNTFFGQQAGSNIIVGAQENTFVGYQAGLIGGGSSTALKSNVALGFYALRNIITGYNNTATGAYSFQSITSGHYNTAAGSNAGGSLQSGHYNVAVGYSALRANVSGSYNVGLGQSAGRYETGSNAFYVDNQDRTDTAGDKAKALLYGIFDATAANQRLTVNAQFTVSDVTDATSAVAASLTTAGGLAVAKSTYVGGTEHADIFDSATNTDVLFKRNTVLQLTLGSLLATFAGDIVAVGGFRQTIDDWTQELVVAGQTAVELTRSSGRWRAPRAGSVTALVVTSTAARVAGTLTITVYKNTGLADAVGAVLGTLSAVLDGTNPSRKATTQAKDTDVFAAGDELYLAVTTDAGWLPITANIRCSLEVET